MLSFFSLLEEITTMWLRQGYRVETPFGTFAPKLKLNGNHTDPEKVKGRDVTYVGVEFIPTKQFIKDADCSRDGFRLQKKSVGNSQMYDSAAMEKALSHIFNKGYTTIKTFMVYSGLKYNSAKNYLDSLCQGEQPRLRCYKEGRTWHYSIIK